MERPAQASVRGRIEADGRVLLLECRTADGDEVWTVPGGRARIGEEPRDAVVREVREETSLEVAVGDPIGVYSFTWDGGERGVVATVFDCEHQGGTVDVDDNPDDERIVGFDWVPPAEADSLPMLAPLQEILTAGRTD